MKANAIKLFFSFLIVFLTAFAGSFFTVSEISTWYATLEKPAFNPPDWIFSPVWTALYILMAVALYLVWQKDFKDKKVRLALWLFIIHLFFNASWSIVFFGFQQIGLAFVNILVLLALIAILTKLFFKIDKRAGYLLIPYLVWVSFATILNYSLMLLN